MKNQPGYQEIDVERGIELREMSKDWIRDNNNEEPTISKDNLEGFRCRALLVDYSAIDFKSAFKTEQVAKIKWMKGFEKNSYVICIHEELGGQRSIRQIKDKNIKD